jgi:hypothetical protein
MPYFHSSPLFLFVVEASDRIGDYNALFSKTFMNPLDELRIFAVTRHSTSDGDLIAAKTASPVWESTLRAQRERRENRYFLRRYPASRMIRKIPAGMSISSNF